MSKSSNREQRCADQLIAWVRGESNHNIIDNECCPDFSCCVPKLFERDRTRRVVYANNWLIIRNRKIVVDA